MFLGKSSFHYLWAVWVCWQSQEDPCLSLSLQGYHLWVFCISSYLHSKIFSRLSGVICLQGSRNLEQEKTNRWFPFLLSRILVNTVYNTPCTQQPISHSEDDKVHVFNMIFWWLRSRWVISHPVNKSGSENTGSKEVDTLFDLSDSGWSKPQRNSLLFVYCQVCLTGKMNQKMSRSSVPPHSRQKPGAETSQLSNFWAVQYKPGSWNSIKNRRCLGNVTAPRAKEKDWNKKRSC